MTQRSLYQGPAKMLRAVRVPRALSLVLWTALGLTMGVGQAQAFPNYPITPQQKATAQKVAEAGVPLSELSPNAPDSYTVKRGDTLWDISKLFLKSPWRWPELWGMNLQQIRNPHLIFPGQYLYLDKSNGRVRLRVGQPVGGDMKLSPRVREGGLYDAITTVPLHLIEPYFNEAVIFDNSDELLNAPRVVATQEGRVLLSRNETAYVRGDVGQLRDWRLFRQPKPLRDPSTNEVLGYEAQYVGTVSVTREGTEGTGADGNTTIIPSSVTVTSIRQEAGVGETCVHYGDSRRGELLVAVGLERARLLVIAVDQADIALLIMKEARRFNTHVPILVRTRDDSQLTELKAAGASEVVPELLESSLMLASHALIMLGLPGQQVQDRVDQVRRDRYRLLHDFYPGADDEET